MVYADPPPVTRGTWLIIPSSVFDVVLLLTRNRNRIGTAGPLQQRQVVGRPRLTRDPSTPSIWSPELVCNHPSNCNQRDHAPRRLRHFDKGTRLDRPATLVCSPKDVTYAYILQFFRAHVLHHALLEEVNHFGGTLLRVLQPITTLLMDLVQRFLNITCQALPLLFHLYR